MRAPLERRSSLDHLVSGRKRNGEHLFPFCEENLVNFLAANNDGTALLALVREVSVNETTNDSKHDDVAWKNNQYSFPLNPSIPSLAPFSRCLHAARFPLNLPNTKPTIPPARLTRLDTNSTKRFKIDVKKVTIAETKVEMML